MRSRVVIEFTHETRDDGSRHLFWLIPKVIDVLRTSSVPLTVRVERDDE